MFPEAFDSPPVPKADATNALYKGWNVTIDRIFFANGQSASLTPGPFVETFDTSLKTEDPWRDATVSADGLSIQSTALKPIAVGDGFHCSDLGAAAGTIDKTIAAVQKHALSSMKDWLSGWKANSTRPEY